MHWIRCRVRHRTLVHLNMRQGQRFLIVLAAVATVAYAGSARADWVWGTGYLWNMSTPFSVTVTSHTDAGWTQMLSQSSADWSKSGLVNVNVGSSGKIDLYDGYYGASEPCAWTQYWQHGGHIAHDAIYLNETCLAGWSDYWKQYAVCQELAHALGLPDHDTTPTSPSCMAPGMPATTPSADDFAELALLYGTTSSTRTKGGGKGGTALSGGPDLTTTSTGSTNTTASGGGVQQNPDRGRGVSGSDATHAGDEHPAHR
jgi:hypothetical protein